MENNEENNGVKAKSVTAIVTEGSGREIVVVITPRGTYVHNTRTELNAKELKFLTTILESPLIKDIEKAIS